MATARQLPSNKPATDSTADRAARWPVLVRIAELRRDDEAPARPPASSEPTYRLDAPHRDVPAPPAPAPQPQLLAQSSQGTDATPASAPASAPTLASPLSVRAAADQRQAATSHQELIRFAAMLALMVAAGMSAVFIMRDRLQPDAEPSSPVAATTGQPKSAEPAVQHVELEPKLEPQLTPETDTSSLEPTATGPLAPPAKPVMALESKVPPAAAPYPTTSLAEVTLPPLEEFQLPKVQTQDVEVARRGETNETTVR